MSFASAAAGLGLGGGILDLFGAGVAGAGASVQAAGAQEVGAAEQAQANYQAQVAKVNAQIAGENATYAMAAGQEEAGIAGLQGAGQVGEIKAAQGASNIDVNTGSAEKVQVSARAQNELSSEDILNNASLSAYGYRAAQTSETAQAGLETMVGEQAPIAAGITAAEAEESGVAGALEAAGGALSNASGMSLKWLTAAGSGS